MTKKGKVALAIVCGVVAAAVAALLLYLFLPLELRAASGIGEADAGIVTYQEWYIDYDGASGEAYPGIYTDHAEAAHGDGRMARVCAAMDGVSFRRTFSTMAGKGGSWHGGPIAWSVNVFAESGSVHFFDDGTLWVNGVSYAMGAEDALALRDALLDACGISVRGQG